LKMPDKFETTIMERYQRRENSSEEALIVMYLAGVLMRRVEDVTQALWGTRPYMDMCHLYEGKLSHFLGG